MDYTKLNETITKNFPQVAPINSEMGMTFAGISRLIMLDRYTLKDPGNSTLAVGDLVVLTVKEDPNYPTRGIGHVLAINGDQVKVEVEEESRGVLDNPDGIITRRITEIEKPLELFYEQVSDRVARGIAESAPAADREQLQKNFYHELVHQNFIPAGRVLYGAGTNSEVTYFNCYVMPFIQDSREGIAKHRQEVMEIMSRGGGVGTNGSTLRPRAAVVHGVNGKSSGALSWLNDLANLTHLVEQGGSRRGAQMIMMADWHPDIFEFILAKIQNPYVLKYLISHSESKLVQKLASDKLDFEPMSQEERSFYEQALENASDSQFKHEVEEKLRLGGTYSVKNADFLTGANISVCLTKEFMEAVENDGDYALRFPDVDSYDAKQMADYNDNWNEIGDVREWEKTGRAVRTYRTIKARELWDLITFCATYSAEPGIFFIDNANEMTNATAYGQKVVATNPCGEQPLTPYAVCNLSSINLANVVNKETKTIDEDKLKRIVRNSVNFQDLVIDATPYFFDKNEKQAKGERRVGMGIMGLADMLIYCEKRYGSKEGNELIDHLFEIIATTAYRESIELAKKKGSFPFLVGKSEAETMELRHKFINSGYMKKMPEDIRQDVLKYGIRNSHLLTVAPTGSTGTMTGVSTGLEPYFSFSYFRSGRLGKFIEVNAGIVEEYLENHPEADKNHLPDFFVSAMELTPKEHVDVQCVIQRWVDSSISKTVNAPKGYSVKQVAQIYQDLYTGGAKGGTVYVDGSRDSQVLTLTTDENKMVDLLDDDDTSKVVTIDEAAKAVEQVELYPEFDAATAVSEAEDNKENAGQATPAEMAGRKEGLDDGDICPICHNGIVKTLGGCATCPNCKIQLKCGL